MSFWLCRCNSCAGGDEQYCEAGATLTFNSDEKNVPGIKTRGGYADHVVVDQKCVSIHYRQDSAPDMIWDGYVEICLQEMNSRRRN